MYTENQLVYEDESKKVLVECLDADITTFKIDTETKLIKEGAFDGCNSLKTLDLSASDDLTLESNSFIDCPVKKLILGSNINIEADSIYLADIEILESAFIEEYLDYFDYLEEDLNYIEIAFPNLKEINVPKQEESDYFSIDGVLYAKDLKKDTSNLKLIHYPAGKDGEVYKLEDKTISITGGGFIQNPFLKKIIFPDSFTYFYTDAILDCENLKELEFNEKSPINVIEFFAHFCKNLDTVIVNNKDSIVKIPKVKTITFADYIFSDEHSFKNINKSYKEKETER